MKAKLVGFILLLVLLGVAGMQRRVMNRARAEHQQLQAVARESTELKPPIREESEEERAARRELARLRNEVRQLRTQKPDISRLRSDNERLAARIAEMSKPRQPASEDQGFVLR